MNCRQRGMTLMELLVVITIIGLLAAIAYPSYRAQVRRSNRTEARVALEQTAGALEKCYTRYMVYNDLTNCPTANQFDAGGGSNTPRGFSGHGHDSQCDAIYAAGGCAGRSGHGYGLHAADAESNWSPRAGELLVMPRTRLARNGR